MNGRRRETRFLPSTPWNASLQTRTDIVLERADDREVWALSDMAASRGDRLTLDIATGGLRLDVRVISCDPVLMDGGVRHRLRLQLLDSDAHEMDDLVWAAR
jgi:hypothetical protein